MSPRRPAAERTRRAVAALAPELTARQLAYWVEQGWIVAEDRPAQGHPRTFSEAEQRVLAVMARLVRAGFPARMASAVARHAVTAAGEPAGRPGGVGLGDDITVIIGNV